MNEHAAIHVQSMVTSKGQTTIPKELRDVLGIREGTPLRWKLENGVLTVRPKTRRLEDFVPLVPPNGRHVTVEQMDDAIAEAVAERDRRSKG